MSRSEIHGVVAVPLYCILFVYGIRYLIRLWKAWKRTCAMCNVLGFLALEVSD